MGLFPARYDIDDLSSKKKRGVSPLDPNHSHFILVDNGTEGQFGKEIAFRAAFEQFMSKKMKMVNKNNSKCSLSKIFQKHLKPFKYSKKNIIFVSNPYKHQKTSHYFILTRKTLVLKAELFW